MNLFFSEVLEEKVVDGKSFIANLQQKNSRRKKKDSEIETKVKNFIANLQQKMEKIVEVRMVVESLLQICNKKN